jgi:PAS domain S-box-containing protein
MSTVSKNSISSSPHITESIVYSDKSEFQDQIFDSLVRSSHYLFWQSDQEGRFTCLNPAWEKTLGYPLKQMLGKSLEDFQSKEIAKRDKIFFSSLLGGETFNGYETECISRSGSIIYLIIDASPIINAVDGKCVGTQGIAFNLTERKKIEKSVKRSEALLLHSQQVASVGYYIFDIWTSNWTNSPMIDIVFGIDETYNKTMESWMELIHPEDRKEVFDHLYNHVINKHNPFNKEYRVIRKNDGTIRWVHTLGELEFSGNGSPIKLFGTIQDITERKLTEIALTEREARLKSIFRAAPVGIGLIIDNQITEVNERFCEMTGYDRRDILGNSTKIFYSDVLEYKRVDQYSKKQMSKTGIGTVETQWVKKNGTIMNVLLSSSPLDELHLSRGISFTVLDITDYKRADDALAREKERLSVTLRSIADGVIATDTEGKIVLINHAAEQLTGWKQNDCFGMPLSSVFNIIDETSRKPCQNPVQKILQNRNTEKLTTQTILISRDGQERLIENSGAPIRDKNGSIIGIVLVFRDITEKEKLMEAIQNNQRLESLGILAGGIAHDFNNIMSGIFGYIELARDESDNQLVTQYLKEALKAIGRVKGLTQQLLTFAKGGEPVRKTSPLFPFVTETAKFALSGSNVSSITEIHQEIWPCDYDANQLGQVIDNIVINAQQAMPLGGTIFISAKNVIIGNNHPILNKGKYVQISIKDSGIGIPKEILPKIFDPFFTTKQKGSGLGLTTSYSIIHRHRGTIEVQSEPGKGSTFHIFLPASENTLCISSSTNIAFHQGNGRILLVDDEEIILNTVKAMLESMKYSVVCKNEGSSALDLYKNELSFNPFSAIIVDLTIPAGMGGKELVKEIRKTDTEIPVFVSSGYAEDPIMADPKKYGFTGSLSKPFKKSDLMELLDKHLPKK